MQVLRFMQRFCLPCLVCATIDCPAKAVVNVRVMYASIIIPSLTIRSLRNVVFGELSLGSISSPAWVALLADMMRFQLVPTADTDMHVFEKLCVIEIMRSDYSEYGRFQVLLVVCFLRWFTEIGSRRIPSIGNPSEFVVLVLIGLGSTYQL
jgi:hypothetical protein